jgi:hypothetical protein
MPHTSNLTSLTHTSQARHTHTPLKRPTLRLQHCQCDRRCLQAAAAELKARRDAQAEGAYKKAAAEEERQSKRLVQVTSEYGNGKAALKDEVRALEALQEGLAEGGKAEVSGAVVAAQRRLLCAEAVGAACM